MNRRDFVRLLSSALAAIPISAYRSGAALAQPDLRNLIDIHCHIFNARDLPVEGFIQNIVIPHEPKFKQLSGNIRSALLFYIRELSEWANDNAFDQKAEIEVSGLGIEGLGLCNGNGSAHWTPPCFSVGA